jgi:hypothetical protein
LFVSKEGEIETQLEQDLSNLAGFRFEVGSGDYAVEAMEASLAALERPRGSASNTVMEVSLGFLLSEIQKFTCIVVSMFLIVRNR